MNRIVHFEIGAEDPARAKMFYEKVFGWKIEKWDGPEDYWMIMTGDQEMTGGINGGLFKRINNPKPAKDHRDAMNNICTVDIENIDETIKKIEENDGELVEEKMEIPETGTMAYVRDTEGNIFGLMQGVEKM